MLGLEDARAGPKRAPSTREALGVSARDPPASLQTTSAPERIARAASSETYRPSLDVLGNPEQSRQGDHRLRIPAAIARFGLPAALRISC
jgi:hypothetical protein